MGTTPEISIVIPVFNQAENIVSVLEGVANSTTLRFELILVDDASTDETESVISDFLARAEERGDVPNLVSARLFQFSESQFETACDAFGIETADARYVIELQADMTLGDRGYDARLVLAMKQHQDLIAISGRGVEKRGPIWDRYSSSLGADILPGRTVFRYALGRLHSRLSRRRAEYDSASGIPQHDFGSVIWPSSKEFELSGKAGLLGPLISMSADLGARPLPLKLWFGETVMRGPLIIDVEKVERLGGWPEDLFFQGYDEHFAWLLAHTLFGWRVAYHPVVFSSPLELGTTRKKRSIVDEFRLLRRAMKFASIQKVVDLIVSRLTSSSNPPLSEVRRFGSMVSS